MKLKILIGGFWVAIYLALSCLNPFSDHHFLYNLEPYPDGLFYVVPAVRWARDLSFSMTYDNTTAVRPSVLPLYSLVLGIGYQLVTQPAFFYAVNVGLGVLTILGLWRLLLHLKVSHLGMFLGLGVYLVHFIVVWLPSVPMAENLGLALFVWGIVALAHYITEATFKKLFLTIITISSLVFIKYTFILPVAVLSSFLLFMIWQKKLYFHLILALVSWTSLGTLFILYQVGIGFNPLGIFTTFGQESSVIAKTTFYSGSYLVSNSFAYLKVLAGGTTSFLWLQQPFTNGLLVLVAGYGYLKRFRALTSFSLFSIVLLLVFISQLPVLLIFYVVDARYLILSLPLIVIGVALSLDNFSHRWLTAGVVLGSCLFLGFQERSLVKSVLAANWLGRSEAWQYRAIQVADIALKDEPGSYLITALPPFLAEMYSQGNYILLPLSPSQEFLEKGQNVWPKLANPDDLFSEYQRLLSQGNKLYVTNAYLSAEAEFTLDMETIRQNFKLELLQTGCEETCNIYSLKTLTSNY